MIIPARVEELFERRTRSPITAQLKTKDARWREKQSFILHVGVFGYFVLGVIALLFLCRTLSPKIFHRLIVFFGMAAVLVAFAPVLMPDSLRPIQQFQARAWIGFLPVALTIAMIGMRSARVSPVVFERASVLSLWLAS